MAGEDNPTLSGYELILDAIWKEREEMDRTYRAKKDKADKRLRLVLASFGIALPVSAK